MSFTSIEPLNGHNFKKWRQDIEIVLGLNDLDLALREDKPAALTATSTQEEKVKFEKWEKANRMSLLIMKRAMADIVKGGIEDNVSAKAYLEAITDKYKESEKAETSNLMAALTTKKFDGKGSVREFIMSLIDIAAKLKALKIPIVDEFVVHQVLCSLPDQYEHLITIYSAQKEKWTLNELIGMCVQEEERFKKGKVVAEVNFVQQGTNNSGKKVYKNNKKNFSKSKGTPDQGSSSKTTPDSLKAVKTNKFKCFHCHKAGHFKKDCDKWKAWMIKKGYHKKEDTKEG